MVTAAKQMKNNLNSLLLPINFVLSLHSAWTASAAAACSSGRAVGIPAVQRGPAFPGCVPTHPCPRPPIPSFLFNHFQWLSRSRSVLLSMVQFFLCCYAWLNEQPKMQRKVSGEQYDVKCPTILKIYY